MARSFGRTLRLLTDGTTAYTPTPVEGNAGIRSPWSASTLTTIVLADLLGDAALEASPVTRAEAMSVPAIARGRNLLCTTIARQRLRLWAGAPGDEAPTPAQAPAWFYRGQGRSSVQHRHVWTVDDLIFHGWSLWARDLDGPDPTDINSADRIPAQMWRFGEDGLIEVRAHLGTDEFTPAQEDEVILIPGYHEGILSAAARTIRGSRHLEDLWAERAANPIPAVELRQTVDDELTDDEIDTALDDWKVALTGNGGAVGFTPYGLELHTHGEGENNLLIQGRNSAAIDAARALGVPAAMVDASNVNSTLTYETQEGRSSDFVDYSVPLYADAITARLSLDDVTPEGTFAAFDPAGLPPANRTPNRED